MNNFCFLITFCFILLGCASKKVTINLDKDIRTHAYLTNTSSFKPRTIHLEIKNFKDLRKKGNQIGEMKSGMSNKLTPIELDRDLGRYLQDDFEKGFIKRGLIFSGKKSLILRGEIERFWVEEVSKNYGVEHSQCQIQLSFELIEKKSQFVKWQGSYNSKLLAKGTIGDTSSNNAPTLKSCVNEVVEKLVRDPKFQKHIF